MILALLLIAQDVTVSVTPEPMALTRALYGNVKEMGTWQVRACSNIDAPLMLPAARIFIAAADLRFIAPQRAAALLGQKRTERRAHRAARYIGYGLQLATAATGYARLSPDLVRGLALGIPIATQAADSLRQRDLIFDSAELLQGALRLEPFGCIEGTAFAAIQRSPQPKVFSLSVPGPRRSGISSIGDYTHE